MKARRGLLATARSASTNRIVVESRAVDDFGELRERKQTARDTAAALGHDLGIWKARGDVYGRQDARCRLCSAMATVCVEPPTAYGLGLAYGKALTDQCRESGDK